MTTKYLFGIKCHIVSIEEVLEMVDKFIKDRKPRMIVTLNPEIVVKGLSDVELRKILLNSDLNIPDGIGIIFAFKILFQIKTSRLPGIDLCLKLIITAARNGYRVFLLGGTEEVINSTKRRLLKEYSNLNIVGIHHGYLKTAEIENSLKNLIIKSHPDILFVGMGSPLQEKWIASNYKELNIPVSIGVGGSFDVISGSVKRAPLSIQKMGLEWLYRLLKEPRRAKRQLMLIKFVWLIFKERVKIVR